MKKQSILFNLIGVMLCGISTSLAAADCCYPYNDCCEWSFCDGKIKLGADWLYWKATEDNLILGSVAQVTSAPSTLPIVACGSAVKQKFKYDNGFRVNLGYELPCDCWDLNVSYTYFPSSSSSRTVSFVDSATTSFSPNLIDFPILGSFNEESFLPPTIVSSKWNLTLNNIDVDLGRTLCFGECLKIRPHIGFRAAWFDQKLRFAGIAETASEPVQSYAATLSEKFTGYGVEGGLWGEWNIGYGMSIVGHFGGSILYSKFRLNEFATSSLITPAEELIVINSRATFHSGTPTMDYFVGLQYADCFCDMLFSVHAGWEQHVLFDVNRLAHDGNLATQGLTLGLEVGF